MDGTGRWAFGGVFVLVSILGLALAANARDGVMYGVGLAVFVFCVLFIFGLMRRTFDEIEKSRGGH